MFGLVCGRVVASLPRDYLACHFGVDDVVAAELPPRFNVAPGAELYAVAGTRHGRRLGTMTWGLVPSWASDTGRGPRPGNARAETLAEKPLFSEALERRRAVVPVSGFYEWTEGPEGRQPFLLSAADGQPLALAALWDRWIAPDGRPLVTFAIVTTAASSDVDRYHNRMPAVLSPQAAARWMDPTEHSPALLRSLLAPSAKGSIVARPVSRRVNDARNDGPEILASDLPPSAG